MFRSVADLFVSGAGRHSDAPIERFGTRSRIDAALAELIVEFWQARGTLAACAITARSSFATPYRDGENDRINWTPH